MTSLGQSDSKRAQAERQLDQADQTHRGPAHARDERLLRRLGLASSSESLPASFDDLPSTEAGIFAPAALTAGTQRDFTATRYARWLSRYSFAVWSDSRHLS